MALAQRCSRGNPGKGTINQRLYLYASQELPVKLLAAIIENSSCFKLRFQTDDKVGIAAVPTRSVSLSGWKHDEVRDDYHKGLAAASTIFTTILRRLRKEFQSVRIEDWYLITLASYDCGEDVVVPNFRRTASKTWAEYSSRFSHGVRFANKVWNGFKKMGGIVT